MYIEIKTEVFYLRILGIDPGFATVGFGVIDYSANKFTTINYGVICTDKNTPFPERLKILYDSALELIEKYKPDCLSIEELFFNTNVKTAIAVGHARGVLILAAHNAGLPIYEYTPLQIKQALTGYGRADKQQIQHMVKTFLNLAAIPRPDDAADALAVAVCHAHSSRLTDILGRK